VVKSDPSARPYVAPRSATEQLDPICTHHGIWIPPGPRTNVDQQ
jgi:hypothetical protein